MTEIAKMWLMFVINRVIGVVGPSLMTYGISFTDKTPELVAGGILTLMNLWMSQRNLKNAIESTPQDNDKPGTIKSVLIILPLLFLPLTGCASNGQTTEEHVVSITPYVRPAVNALCTVVLNAAIDDKDRKDKAIQIHNLSIIVETLALGEFPTVEEFHRAIENNLPGKSHWASLTKSLASLYKGQYPNLVKGDTKVWVNFAAEFVGGIADATEGYVD